MADTRLGKIGITVKEPWSENISYEVLDMSLFAVENGGDGCSYVALRNNIGVTPGTDPNTWMKSTQAGQSIYDLAVKYHHFVGTEEEFEAEYQAALQAARDAAAGASAVEAQVEAAEALRVAAETSRADAESARQSAEASRASAETARGTAEAARQSAESGRASAETARASAETERNSAESERASAEAARAAAEADRVSDFSALRTDMQTAIGQADAATAAAVATNNQIQTAEAGRVSAEQGRVSAETARASAESARATAETSRATAETARVTAEGQRATAEGQRVTAENARVSAESGRASAESARVTAEAARVSAETARESQASSDHTRAESDHAIAAEDHATLDEKLANKANKDGHYSGMTVGSAENLVGRGSVEAEYQGIRTSAGNEDIGNGNAMIREVRGKSLAWNQLIPLKTTDTNNGITFTQNEDGSITVNGTATATALFQLMGTGILISGHRYILCGGHSGDSVSTQMLAVNKNDSYNHVAAPSVAFDADSSQYSIYIRVANGVTVNNLVYFPNLIDLTLGFGAGNEPSTVEEFERMFPLPYYAFNPGTIINNEATGIKTVGFNLFNPATGKAVLPGKYSDYPYEYEICGAFTSISFEDYAGNVSTPELHNGRFFNVPSPGVLTVTGAGNDTLVHLVWSGWRNYGEPDYAYEPYWENTLQLNLKTITGKLNGEGESVIIYPNGMRGDDTAYDYLIVDADGYARRAMRVMESVDMGTLTGWKGDSGKYYTAALRNRAKYPVYNGEKASIVCAKYITTSRSNQYDNSVDMCVAFNYLGDFCVNDFSITATGQSAIAAALSGVLFIFELATPLEYVLDTPIYLGYPVDDFGTEAKLPVDNATLPTGPVRYMVNYPFNAVDTLRRIPQNYLSKESTQNLLTALKTANIIGDFTITFNATTQQYNFNITAPTQE